MATISGINSVTLSRQLCEWVTYIASRFGRVGGYGGLSVSFLRRLLIGKKSEWTLNGFFIQELIIWNRQMSCQTKTDKPDRVDCFEQKCDRRDNKFPETVKYFCFYICFGCVF
jgi:hypothetical protein